MNYLLHCKLPESLKSLISTFINSSKQTINLQLKTAEKDQLLVVSMDLTDPCLAIISPLGINKQKIWGFPFDMTFSIGISLELDEEVKDIIE